MIPTSTAAIGADTIAVMAQNLPFVLFFAGWVWITRKQDDARTVEREKNSVQRSTEVMDAWKLYFSGERAASDESHQAQALIHAAALEALGTTVEHSAETMSRSLELVTEEISALRGEQTTLVTAIRDNRPRGGGR